MASATLQKYIPIAEAAAEFDISLEKIKNLITSGNIEAIQLTTGELAVSEACLNKPLQKEDLPEFKQFSHLSGQTIWISKASRDYEIPQPTISRWVKDGIIKVVRIEGQKKYLNTQDVAYCAYIYQQHKEEGTQGRRIFDTDGTPYEPKSGPFAI